MPKEVGINPVWRVWGEYCLAPKWREWAISRMDLDPSQIKIDLFADEKNAARPLFISRDMDAFSFNWSNLVEGEEILWANPPFVSIEKVLSKICVEPTQVLLCIPEWPETKWWEMLTPLVRKKVVLPESEELFYGVIRKKILEPPKWRTWVYWLDSRGYMGPPPKNEVLRRIKKANMGKGKEALGKLPPPEPIIKEVTEPEEEILTGPENGQEEGGEGAPPLKKIARIF